MSVIRIKKKRTPYVTLDTTALNDPRLSFRAKGLHAYLCSKPDDWQVQIAHLERESQEGRDAIRKALQELEAAGYLRREKQRDARGRLQGWATTVYETPALALDETAEPPAGEPLGFDQDDAPDADLPTTDSPTSVSPKSVLPTSVSPKSENPLLLNLEKNQDLNLVSLEKNYSLASLGSCGDRENLTVPPAAAPLAPVAALPAGKDKGTPWLTRQAWEATDEGEFFDLLTTQSHLWQQPAFVLDGDWWHALDTVYGDWLTLELLRREFAKMVAHFLTPGERRPVTTAGWKRQIRSWLDRTHRQEARDRSAGRRTTHA